jgi:hypothetical protein
MLLARRAYCTVILLGLLEFLVSALGKRLARAPEALGSTQRHELSESPVIGVLFQPIDEHRQYLAASYSKYAAMAGARVVPVFCNMTKSDLQTVYHQINGLIVPGMHSYVSW